MTRRILIALALFASVAVLAALTRDTTRPAGSIATVDTLRLMERMLEMPEFADVRDTKIEEFQNPLRDLDTRLRAMITQWQTMDPSTPEANELRGQAELVQQQLMQAQQDAQLGIDAFAAGQFAAAFRKVRATAADIAANDGYQYVMTSRFDDENILTNSTSLFVQEILYRSALIAPEGTDITDAVAKALSIPEPTPEPAVDSAPTTEPMPTPSP